MEDFISVRYCNFFNVLITDISEKKKLFFLPKYQRPFAWEDKQIEDFWNDIIFTYEETPGLPYLLGSIYLAKVNLEELRKNVNSEILSSEKVSQLLTDEKDYYLIIDGQQRTITFFLFLLAFGDNPAMFVGQVPVMIPGKADYVFFLDFCNCSDKRTMNTIAKSRSNERIIKAFQLFQKKKLAYKNPQALLDFVRNNVQVVQILIERNIELATSLFVSQTDRGKRLTNLEKLKSTLMFYVGKVGHNALPGNDIDNLFARLFENIDALCSKNARIYRKADTAEADVLRILNFFAIRDGFYAKHHNDLIADKDERIEIWYEAGEDRIYEAINRVFRKALLLEDRETQIRDVAHYLIEQITAIASFYEHLATDALSEEKANSFKDLYSQRIWFPFKQLYNLLGLSVFSKSLMVELHADPQALSCGFSIPKHKELNAFDPFVSIERIKKVYEKLKQLKDMETLWPDIALIKKIPPISSFLEKHFDTCIERIQKYKYFTTQPMSPFNLIEECELAVWRIGKRPFATFVWNKGSLTDTIDHIKNCSFSYKRDFMIRDLSYDNFKYVLYEYERMLFDYSDKELHEIIDYDIDEDDEILIQREHVFAQNPESYDEIERAMYEVTKENYNVWIWNIGNITLLEHTINIGNAGNKAIWDKATVYLEKNTAFKGTRKLASDILSLKKIIDENAPTNGDALANAKWMAFKLFFEIRELELLSFAFYRFA